MSAAPPGPQDPGAEPDPGPEPCSAKGCTEEAAWALLWNNPRLHTPERRKTWLACDAHREHLAGFLGARGFLRDVRPHPEPGREG